jgi:hypothetical protein
MGFALRPTNSFIVFPTYWDVPNRMASACFLITPASVAQWAADNASLLTVLGNTYTVKNPANFVSVIGGDGNGIWTNQYYTLPDTGYLAPGTLLTDLGKDIFIGVPDEPNILHLRLVQAPGTLGNQGKGGWVGYTPVGTYAFDIFTDTRGTTTPIVSVARI